VHDDEYVTVFEHGGKAYVRKGPWKLVQIDRPFNEDDFVLFYLNSDWGETTDLSEDLQEKYQELLQPYRDYVHRVHVIPVH
jgi:arylsulfatase